MSNLRVIIHPGWSISQRTSILYSLASYMTLRECSARLLKKFLPKNAWDQRFYYIGRWFGYRDSWYEWLHTKLDWQPLRKLFLKIDSDQSSLSFFFVLLTFLSNLTCKCHSFLVHTTFFLEILVIDEAFNEQNWISGYSGNNFADRLSLIDFLVILIFLRT